MEPQQTDKHQRQRVADLEQLGTKLNGLTVRRNSPGGLEAAPNWSMANGSCLTATITALTTGKTPLYLYGETGTGKTSLAALVFQAWPRDAFWYSAPELTRLVGECRRKPDGMTFQSTPAGAVEFWEAAFWSRIQTASLVVVDEIVRKGAGIGIEIMEEILKYRANRFTIFTGNLSPAEMAKAGIDSRFVSRIGAGLPAFSGTKDLR